MKSYLDEQDASLLSSQFLSFVDSLETMLILYGQSAFKFKDIYANLYLPKITEIISFFKSINSYLLEFNSTLLIEKDSRQDIISDSNTVTGIIKISNRDSIGNGNSGNPDYRPDMNFPNKDKIVEDLELDDTIHFNYFGRQYPNRQALLMVKDSINMIDIIINDRSKLTILFNKYKFNKKISNVKDISEYKNSIWFVNLDTLTNFSEKDHLIYTFFIRNMFVNNFMLYSKDLVVDYKLLIAGNTQVDLIKEILSNILKNSLKIEMSSNDITNFLNKYRIKDDILININSKSDTLISHLEFDNEEDLRIFNSLKAASLFMYNNFTNICI